MRLLDTGIERLGFVSPTHMVPQMAALVEALWQRGRYPVIVYNSGGYYVIVGSGGRHGNGRLCGG